MKDDSDGSESDPVLTYQHDPDSDESILLSIVRLVAVASDKDPTELTPLREAVDPDAVENLLSPKSETPSDKHIVLTIGYEGYQIEIRSDGRIRLFDPES